MCAWDKQGWGDGLSLRVKVEVATQAGGCPESLTHMESKESWKRMADLSVLDGENRPGSERLSVRLTDCGNDRT